MADIGRFTKVSDWVWELPPGYREGMRVPGSYLLAGVPGGTQTFFSTAHGSGRTMSRTQARKAWRGEDLEREMASRGIYVRSVSKRGLAEEAGGGL